MSSLRWLTPIVTAEFLDVEVLRPFSKADPFTPGSGLGLGLAQRMIEILGGKIAIASSPNKGTLVQVEIPLHFLNKDSDSDMEELQAQADNDENELTDDNPIRRDCIFMAGFASKEDRGLQRVGKSLLRQLKAHQCRVVPDVSYASLIVVPKSFSKARLAELASRAKPNVEICILKSREPSQRQDLTVSDTDLEDESKAFANLEVTYLTLPLRPSLVAKLMKPRSTPVQAEEYASEVVGGDAARRGKRLGPAESHTAPPPLQRSFSESRQLEQPPSLDTIAPSPVQDLFEGLLPSPKSSRMSSSSSVNNIDSVISNRPLLKEHTTDPMASLQSHTLFRDTSLESLSSSDEPNRPTLAAHRSTPVEPVTPMDPSPLKGEYE